MIGGRKEEGEAGGGEERGRRVRREEGGGEEREKSEGGVRTSYIQCSYQDV